MLNKPFLNLVCSFENKKWISSGLIHCISQIVMIWKILFDYQRFVSHVCLLSLLFKFVFVTEMNEKYKLGLLDKWQIYFSKYIFFLLLYFQLRSVCMLTIVHSKLSTTTSFSYYSCKLSFFVFWTFNCDKNWNKWQV
jgi:energy-coupling factor transporter transmembrane protein EcfT